MKLFATFTVKFCSLHSQSEVKFAPKLFLTCATRGANFTVEGNFTFLGKLHSPKANLVVEPTCETHDGLDMACSWEHIEGVDGGGGGIGALEQGQVSC